MWPCEGQLENMRLEQNVDRDVLGLGRSSSREAMTESGP